MNIVEYIIEHSRTLLNIYFQQGQTVLTPPGPLPFPLCQLAVEVD